jgi:hypothetical protein
MMIITGPIKLSAHDAKKIIASKPSPKYKELLAEGQKISKVSDISELNFKWTKKSKQ